MRAFEVVYYPRTTKHEFKEEINGRLNPDYVGYYNVPTEDSEVFAIDYTDLIKTVVYFHEDTTNQEVAQRFHEMNISGLVSIENYWEIDTEE
jgi:hypothetical protein